MTDEKVGWHVADDRANNEPYSFDELMGLAEAGIINSKTLLWRDGLDNWVLLRDRPELAELILDTEELLVETKAPSPPPRPTRSMPKNPGTTHKSSTVLVEDKGWYVATDNEESDREYSFLELKRMADVGIINADTPVWRDGLDHWVRLRDQPELAKLLLDLAAPLPPPRPHTRPAKHPRGMSDCIKCGHLVSHDAKTCPNCGAWNPARHWNYMRGKWGCAILILIFVVGPCVSAQGR